ncbi:hypothetical protein C9F11_08955 [Streptomyces sp. YIM 121038]|uniref:hypothetical protein n=1 Tax=Streptomyces sp. YIM 121038 TaxID=2136401 RepID=UPI001110C110|nr:hypothetical protein [Streptomyces sp. YIM 121038]QCX75480.1 hypothetical protein C9F11_08955 [Streptomyces sp. YIM 121038]
MAEREAKSLRAARDTKLCRRCNHARKRHTEGGCGSVPGALEPCLCTGFTDAIRASLSAFIPPEIAAWINEQSRNL